MDGRRSVKCAKAERSALYCLLACCYKSDSKTRSHRHWSTLPNITWNKQTMLNRNVQKIIVTKLNRALTRAGRSDCNLFLVQQLLALEIWTKWKKKKHWGKNCRSSGTPKTEAFATAANEQRKILNNKYIENVIFLLRRFDAQYFFFFTCPSIWLFMFSPCVSGTDYSMECWILRDSVSPLSPFGWENGDALAALVCFKWPFSLLSSCGR